MKHLLKTTTAYCLLLLLTAGGGFAQVSVTNPTADYSNKKVSFTVSWTAQPHNNQIWVIIDHMQVQGATTVGGWSRALVTAVSASGNGSAATVSGQRGFWLNTSTATGTANVIATLSGVPAQFNWCAYALDTPPKATIKATGGYDLSGTPPFTVNGTTLGDNVKTFGPGTCITSLSDATNNPAFILPALPTISHVAGSGSPTQTVSVNSAISAINFYASNASSITLSSGSLPPGVNASYSSNTFTIHGTPSSVNAYNYTVTTTNSNNCTNASASGTITVIIALPPYSSGTWSNGSQIWSGVLRNPASCTLKSSLTTSTTDANEYFDRGASYGFNYNWNCVSNYATTLCPTPWRVPTVADFDALIAWAEGFNSSSGKEKMREEWGYNCMVQGAVVQEEDEGNYWSSQKLHRLLYNADHLKVHTSWPVTWGLNVRCVRDAQ